MNPGDNSVLETETLELSHIKTISFYKKKRFLIILIIISVVFIFLGILLFFSGLTRSEKIISVISPTPVEVLKQEKTWQVNILYDQSTNLFSIDSLTLNTDGQKQDYSDINSPYVFTVYDKAGKILHSVNVPIVKTVVVPKEFIGTSLEDSLRSKQLESSFQIPYFEKAVKFEISRENTVLIQGKFPESKTSLYYENQSGTRIAEDTDGWSLSATPVCEGGKAFIKYNFNTTGPAVIFTWDLEDRNDPIKGAISINTIDDMSWERADSGLKLVGGKDGTYLATANTINVDFTEPPPHIHYNGPVGFLKGRKYLGTIQTSGDYTDDCEEKSGIGCVKEEHKDGYAETTVTTLSEAICPDVAVSPEPTGDQDQNFLQTCEPESKCESSTETLQICTFTCK